MKRKLLNKIRKTCHKILRQCDNIERTTYGKKHKCQKCKKDFYFLDSDIHEDDYEEPWGGWNSYEYIVCPFCQEIMTNF